MRVIPPYDTSIAIPHAFSEIDHSAGWCLTDDALLWCRDNLADPWEADHGYLYCSERDAIVACLYMGAPST